MIRNVVFDMGMVLLQFHPIDACLRFAPNEADAQAVYDVIFGAPEWKRLDDGTLTESGLLALAKERLPQRLHEAAEQTMAHYQEDCYTQTPGMDRLIAELKANGYGIYLLSNASLRMRTYRQLLPSWELFDGLLVSAEEKLVKPDAAIYRRLCERFGLTAEECFFADDLPVNCDGARAVGFSAHVFDGDVTALRQALRDAGVTLSLDI